MVSAINVASSVISSIVVDAASVTIGFFDVADFFVVGASTVGNIVVFLGIRLDLRGLNSVVR